MDSPRTIFIVTNDGHGDISYWDTKQKATNEVLRIIFDIYRDENTQISATTTVEEILTQFEDWVCFREVQFNKSWE